jgi:Poly(R)-hydroxyalkanoic acid synthase subunit (PHA_synth_III_E)
MTNVNSASQQLFEIWKKQLDEGSQAWSRLLGTNATPTSDPLTFWKPAMEHGLQTWSRIFATTPVTPDLMTQWKQFLDQSIEAWSKALGQMMNTDAFAEAMGSSLDQWLKSYAPVKKATDQSIDATLQALNMPTRAQVTSLAKQIMDLEERLDRLEDGIATVLRRLDAGKAS